MARSHRRVWLSLLGCGGIIEALFIGGFLLPLRMDRLPPSLDTNLARIYGLDPFGLLLYLVVSLGLLVAYAIALRIAWTAPRAVMPMAVVASAIFMATPVWVHPTYSSDVLHYVATARVAYVHGENPHVVPPEAFVDDPLMQLSGWRTLPSPYGAGWTWLSAVPFVMSGGLESPTSAVVAFKLLSVLCALGTVAGVAVAAERLRTGAGALAAVAFGWNPLVVIHFAGDGHNDAAMVLFLAWGIVALVARRPAVAFVLFAAATLIKPVAGLALLMLSVSLARGNDRRSLVIGLATAVLLAVVCYAPLWDGPRVLQPMLEEGGYFTNTPASLVHHGVARLFGEQTTEWAIGVVLRSLLVGIAVSLAWRSRDQTADLVLRIGVVYLLAVVLLGTWYQPWYATWPLVFLSVAVVTQRSRAWLILGLTAGGLLVPVATSFVAAIAGRRAEDFLIDALAVALVLAPLGIAVLLIRRRTAHGPKIDGPVRSPPVKTI
jgi:hypothetical protein